MKKKCANIEELSTSNACTTHPCEIRLPLSNFKFGS